MREIIKCPICGKRVFDLEWEGRTEVEIKCRHCNKIVVIKRPTDSTSHDESHRMSILRT